MIYVQEVASETSRDTSPWRHVSKHKNVHITGHRRTQTLPVFGSFWKETTPNDLPRPVSTRGDEFRVALEPRGDTPPPMQRRGDETTAPRDATTKDVNSVDGIINNMVPWMYMVYIGDTAWAW